MLMRPTPALVTLLLMPLLSCDTGRYVRGQRPEPVTSAPLIRFEDYTLPNGLRVLLAPDKTASTIAVCVTYNVGSRDEPPGHTGWAHLMEHMMFQGSAHVGRGEHRLLVQETGGEFEGDTGQDHTEYYETLPANQLPLALFLEADRMASLDLTQPNLDNQRAVVEAEKSERHSHQPHDVARVTLLGLSYARFGYKHPTIGETADLEAATLADIRAFYRTYYAPNNAVLAVTGNFSSEQAKAEIARRFGPILRRPPPPRVNLTEPPPTGERRMALKDDYSRLQRYIVGYRIPPAASPDFEALGRLSDILGRGRTARLYRLLMDTEQAVGADAYVQGRCGPGLFVITADLPPGSAYGPVAHAIDAEIARVQTIGVTPAELDKAKNWARMDFWHQLLTSSGKARFLAREAVDQNEPNRINTFPARLNAVTPGAVRLAARRYLTRDNRVVLTVSPAAY